MRRINVYKVVFLLQLHFLFNAKALAQESIGMSTGNYAGVTSVWFNPANIADSRYKFDINIIGINSYYNNNYLLVRNTALVHRMFYKDPYNSSFSAVKNDLLQEQLPVNGKVYGRTESNIHFPLSFMATTGKRSAIAITMNNRTVNKIDSMPVDMARAFFGELRDPSLYGKDIRADSMQYNFLNWQEVGFTYSRVIINGKHNFLKLGVTLKWMGANAGAYIQTNNAVVNFKDSQTLSLQSPLIHYARTERADVGQFNRRDIFNNLEDQAFGWDVGLVYEFRGKVKKFRYIDEDMEEQQRRDLNKYMFRIGIAVVDGGRFKLKKRELTDDHSANILNWDFSGVKANNFSSFDTAYSKKVSYISGAPSTFSYRLPTALIGNFDLHFFGGFYINVAAKAPLESFQKNADTYISANKWVAVTPRFESKFLAVYVPVIRQYNRTNIGATVKFGPFYVGSNNLAQILSNKSSYEADFHAGLRLSVPYGKPSRINKFAENLMYGNYGGGAKQSQVDSLRREVELMKHMLNDTVRRSVPLQVIINNDGVAGVVERYGDDSVVIRNNISGEQMTRLQNYDKRQAEVTDSLLREIARKNLEIKRLNQSIEEDNSSKNKKGKKDKKDSKQEITVNNDDLVKEVEKLRKEMTVQNAILAGGGTAAVIAASKKGDKKQQPAVGATDSLTKADSLTKVDSIIKANAVKRDTVYIRDTVTVLTMDSSTLFRTVPNAQFDPIYFAAGKTTVTSADKIRLQQLAVQVNKNPNWRIELTATTDANGTVESNRRVAAARSASVSHILFQSGVRDNQVIMRTKLAGTHDIPVSENQRRVIIRILSRQ